MDDILADTKVALKMVAKDQSTGMGWALLKYSWKLKCQNNKCIYM